MPVFKRKNNQLFRKWSPGMAYVLGFVAADGYLIRNKRGGHFLDLKSTDKEIIYKIRRVFNSNLAVNVYQPKNKNYSTVYRLQIGSRAIFRDLQGLGVHQAKSKTIKLPKVPDHYFSHFLRGYFDGDGNVTVCTYRRKNRNNRLTTILLTGFTCGSMNFIKSLQAHIRKLAHTTGGSLYYQNRAYRLCFSILDSKRLYDFMYKSTRRGLFLKRKKAVFEKYYAAVA